MKILNYGSLNIDYTFQVEAIAQPGQTIAADRVSRFPGGKGFNQSLALARAGAHPFHAGIIVLIVVVFPVPGPPVRIIRPCPAAVMTASF